MNKVRMISSRAFEMFKGRKHMLESLEIHKF